MFFNIIICKENNDKPNKNIGDFNKSDVIDNKDKLDNHDPKNIDSMQEFINGYVCFFNSLGNLTKNNKDFVFTLYDCTYKLKIVTDKEMINLFGNNVMKKYAALLSNENDENDKNTNQKLIKIDNIKAIIKSNIRVFTPVIIPYPILLIISELQSYNPIYKKAFNQAHNDLIDFIISQIINMLQAIFDSKYNTDEATDIVNSVNSLISNISMISSMIIEDLRIDANFEDNEPSLLINISYDDRNQKIKINFKISEDSKFVILKIYDNDNIIFSCVLENTEYLNKKI